MNEWSPGGNYSRPRTPNQTGRSFRSQWNECEKGVKPLPVNNRTVTDNRNRSFQQHSMEDVSKTSLSVGSKNKKVGHGVSDPRFKRVLLSGMQNDACVGTELKSSKRSSAYQEKETLKSMLPVWNIPEFKPNQVWGDSTENTDALKPNLAIYEPPECENVNAEEPVNFDQLQDHLKAVDKLSFSHDIIVKSFSKESLSDCTVNTRNTCLTTEDLMDEFSNDLATFPSATSVKKVQNWIQDQKTKTEKKKSVVTVIGQTQEQNLSSALREIDKRRKLVKELDKYAVCKKIVQSDKEKEISDLVAKINCLSNSGRVVSSKNKQQESNEISNKSFPSSRKGSRDKLDKHPKSYENGQIEDISNDDDMSPEFISPSSVCRRLLYTRKKCYLFNECPIKGRIRDFFNRGQYQTMFCIMAALSGVLCWLAFFSLHKAAYVPFELFTQKPKPMTWYEKICSWIWEIFRPSGNYKRTASWHAY